MVAIVVVICATIIFALFIVLLAMPKSRLRSVLFELIGWFTTVVSGVLVVSPIDIIPDVAIGLGQVDDIGYIVAGVLSALFAYSQRQGRKQLSDGSQPD